MGSETHLAKEFCLCCCRTNRTRVCSGCFPVVRDFTHLSVLSLLTRMCLCRWLIFSSSSSGVNGHGDIFENQDENSWYKEGVKLVKDNLKLKPNTDTAKSAILFLGDGMGVTTITATRILDGQMKGGKGEENVLSWEVFPWSALAKTYAVNQQGPDSASTGTAFLSGIKTNVGKLL